MAKMICSSGSSRTLRSLGLALLLTACGDGEQIAVSACAVPIGDSPARGDENAWVTVVEFADFQCSFCRAAEAAIAEIDEQHPGIRWVFKQFPITSIHSHAEAAASAADCAHVQGKFWEMHDLLFARTVAALSEDSLKSYAESLNLDMTAWSTCFKSDESLTRIASEFEQGEQYGVSGTPTFFINARMLTGLYPVDDMLNVIVAAEREAKTSGVKRADYYQVLADNACQN
jgi:protein-disulfide isomerase